MFIVYSLSFVVFVSQLCSNLTIGLNNVKTYFKHRGEFFDKKRAASWLAPGCGQVGLEQVSAVSIHTASIKNHTGVNFLDFAVIAAHQTFTELRL